MNAQSDDRLREEIEKHARRMDRAERDRGSLLSQSVYMGTVAGLFVLPVVAGAYLGNWLDGMSAGYSVRWTVGMILLGVAVGGVNVYLFVRERL